MCNKNLFIPLILCVSLDFAQLLLLKHDSLTGATDWDILIFTQHWPATVCNIWTHNKPSHSCTYPKVKDTWTIHGSWPTKLGTEGPENCNGTWLFDPEKIRPIEEELEQHWTNIEKGTGPYDLWVHEWNKHGTCAALIEPMNSEFKYFNKGLEFIKQYSMTDILGQSKIHPSNSNSLTVDEINRAISSALGKNPVIHCKYEDHIQYLFELRICLDKQLNLVDCDPLMHIFPNLSNIEGALTDCNVKKRIIYPEQGSSNLELIEFYKFINWIQWFTL